MGIYHKQTVEDLLSLEPLLANNPNAPTNFIPPGVVDPSYVPPYQGGVLLIVVVVTMIVVYSVVGLRLWVRKGSVGIRADDWLVLAATVGLTICSIICMIAVTVIGVGYHSYDLNFHRIDMSYMILQIYICIYGLVILLVRLSILSLIDRIFGSVDLNFRRLIYAIMVLCSLFFVASVLTLVYQCDRVGATFRLASRLEASCSHVVTKLRVISILQIIFDIVVLLLPAIKIWKLRLPMRDRLNMLACFGIGLFVCATGIGRMTCYKRMVDSGDIVWYGTTILIWSHLESSWAIIVSSLPALNKLIIRQFSRCFDRQKRDGSQSSKTRISDEESYQEIRMETRKD